jgi:hypothetical protein
MASRRALTTRITKSKMMIRIEKEGRTLPDAAEK